MNNEYYLVEGEEQKGPYTYNQLIDMGIDIHTEVITAKSDEPQYASNLPEFIEYFESKGIYFPTGDNLAGFGWRILAFIIDYLLVSSVITFALNQLGLIALPKYTGTLDYQQLAPTANLISMAFYPTFLIYNVLFEISNFKATPGKLLCKIMVVDIDGKSLKIANSLIKNLGVCLSFYVVALPFLTALSDEHRQTWYERIAKSYQITKN
jgi:uncharacterized RDD family membrane protein YckC